MSIQELGSLGELVGALAVLVTVVYLSVQTRQARIAVEQTAKFAELQATHSVVDLYSRWRASLLGNPENKVILEKASEGAELSKSEQIAISFMFQDLFFIASYSYSSSVSAGSIHVATADVEYTASILNEYAPATGEWNRIKQIVAKVNPRFVAAVEAQLKVLG